MIGGTSGSDTKLAQPFSSQSKSAQTRFSSLGSRKTVQPLEPCCLRLSAPLVEKIFRNWSKLSTVVVARIITLLLLCPAPQRPSSRTGGCPEDRKSTRLNSSHSSISYAVFCLKKKNNTQRSRYSHLNK